MTADEIAAETMDLPGGPVQLLATTLVLHRWRSAAETLQVPFTPNGPDDVPTTKEAAEADALASAQALDQPPEDRPQSMTCLALDAQTWRDMGQPDTITVSIEPGDTATNGHGRPDMGPVQEIRRIPGPAPAAVIVHRPTDGGVDTRPRHDDVTNPDVRETHDGHQPPAGPPPDRPVPVGRQDVRVDETRRSV